MPKCSMQGRIQVVEQSRCRTHRQQTTTIAQMQSQLSIHSPSPRGRGFRQGCRNKDTPSFKHGCLQVVEQSRCRTHRQQTTTIAQMQSQLSIHSPSPRGRGFRQGCRNKDTPSFKHGCLQVVEQSRCRTHRQQTTTIAETQSHQSVLKGIGIINQKLISKTGFSYPIS